MNALETGIYSALTGGTALTALLSGTAAVYNTEAPQGAAEPFVVFNEQASTPVYHLPALAYENILIQVQGVTTGNSMALAGSIADAIDGILNDGTISVSGYGLMYARRESGVSYAETVEGRRWNHSGALYRFMLDPQ